MIWVTRRQQRFEALIAAALLALAALFLLVTGLDMASTYHTLGVAACLASRTQTCGEIFDAFRTQFSLLVNIVGWFEFLPLLFGVLLAAPLVLELEQGTYRLAWTQSITRLRWITWKLSLLVAAAVLLALALTAILTWWRTPLDQMGGRFDRLGFDFEGVVPVAYTVFALALGLAVGTLLRRAIPALALALVGFFVVRVVVEDGARPTYLPPLVQAATQGNVGRAAWILDQSYRDHLGHPVGIVDLLRLCGVSIDHGQGAHIVPACLARHGIVNAITYQPADRFWLFQGIESAIFLGLTAGLLALTVWWVRYRIA